MAFVKQIPDRLAARQSDKPFLGKFNHALNGGASRVAFVVRQLS